MAPKVQSGKKKKPHKLYMDLIHTFAAISDMIMLIIIKEIVSRSGMDV